MKIIAKIYNDFNEKFGVPRQSGIVKNLSRIVFEPEFRIREAFLRLDEYSHLWLIWKFSETEKDGWSPTVRPPKLGGNSRVGVFATRSPFRPNPIGLSCVKLVKIDYDSPDSPALVVEGADIVNETPIFDVKPYVPYADCIIDANGGFSVPKDENLLNVSFNGEIRSSFSKEYLLRLKEILEQNPIPSYKKDFDRVYKMSYANKTVSFTVNDTCVSVIKIED